MKSVLDKTTSKLAIIEIILKIVSSYDIYIPTLYNIGAPCICPRTNALVCLHVIETRNDNRRSMMLCHRTSRNYAIRFDVVSSLRVHCFPGRIDLA